MDKAEQPFINPEMVDEHPICSCGKSTEEHIIVTFQDGEYNELAWHHYWFYHKYPIPECSICMSR